MHRQLLAVARNLAATAPGAGPNQEGFYRRTASTAYYALFHLLTRAAATRLATGTASPPQSHAAHFARVFDHGLMGAVLAAISGYPTPPPTPIGAVATHRVNRTLEQPIGNTSVPVALMWVAYALAKLKAERHLADYNFHHPYTAAQAQNCVNLAQTAFAQWRAVRADRTAKLHLSLLNTYEHLKA